MDAMQQQPWPRISTLAAEPRLPVARQKLLRYTSTAHPFRSRFVNVQVLPRAHIVLESANGSQLLRFRQRERAAAAVRCAVDGAFKLRADLLRLYFRAAFNLTDGGLGATHAAGTFASALKLTSAGRLIDYTSVCRFT